ncbi:MAG TPA: FecR family protein [Chthoniobacterales bacterium]|jgi:hypothetical protein
MVAGNSPSKVLVKQAALVTLVVFVAINQSTGAGSPDEARVTKIVRDVRLLPEGAKAKPAAINEQVSGDTGVKTGDRSRSELTFVDLTIERLGANTLFHFDKGGRQLQLDGGSMLLCVPKNSGGAQMSTPAVTVGVTGTTLILETTSAGRNKLIVLEGSARLSLNRYPRESVTVKGGQMEDVPAGATKLPPPVNINLNDVMQHHPLIADFGPLPTENLIANQSAPSQPVGPGPAVIAPIVGGILGGGPIVIGPGPIGGGTGGSGGRHPDRHPKHPGSKTGGQSTVGTTDGTPNTRGGATRTPGQPSPKPKPTPIPKRKPKVG